MQNVKSIDNQLVKCTVVQMWFKHFGIGDFLFSFDPKVNSFNQTTDQSPYICIRETGIHVYE